MDWISQTNKFLHEVFDTNEDGVISTKEILMGLAHHAPAILLLFVDLVVIVAEVRVYDAGMQMTHLWIKALGFVLVSALPFYLGQIAWLYPRANRRQKFLAILFVIGGLIGSAIFGRADLLLGVAISGADQTVNPVFIANLVIYLTAGYIGLGLIYLLVDPDIKAWRTKISMKAKSEQQKEFNKIVRDVLSDQKLTMQEQTELEDLYGADNVTFLLNELRNRKNNKSSEEDHSIQNPTSRGS
jgi:hypothetical protein